MGILLNYREWKKLYETSFAFDPSGNYPDPTFGLPTGGVDSGRVSPGGAGGDWDGSMQRALAFGKIANEFMGKNVISSQKRTRVKTASGNTSDHFDGQGFTYAVDLACSGSTGDKLLAHLMEWFGHPEYTGGSWFNVVKDGYRYQIGWRVPGHFDHIHVGVKKVDAKDTVSGVTQTPLANNMTSAIIHDLNLVKNGTQLLKSGSTGGAVKAVQQKLKEKRPDLFTKEPNGEFDKDTYNAIKAFQISEPNPIKDDGIVGPITYGKLFDVQINPVATGSDKLSGSYNTYHDNNPFNLRPNRKTQFNGYVGKKEAFRGTQSIGNFAVFDTMANGIRAGMKNLEGYFTRRNLNTISQIINTYAPGGSTGQPQSATDSYVNSVVSYMQKNWNPDVTSATPLSFSGPNETHPDNIKMFKTLVSAIAKQEGKLTPELIANINSFDTKNLA